MDEPTSGLDARAAAVVMRAVKNVVANGRTTVCTIHQPSINIFETFDELILMKSGGKVIYNGMLGHHSNRLIEYFQETSSSSAQYILQQYIATSGGLKLQNSIINAYAMGKVRMVASEFKTAKKVTRSRNSSKAADSGGFVLWQMNPDMWYVELALGGSKVHAGCNGLNQMTE